MKHRIEEGDLVHVEFNCSRFVLCHSAFVIKIPMATGGSWVFEDSFTKQIHYVSEGCTITKLFDKEDAHHAITGE